MALLEKSKVNTKLIFEKLNIPTQKYFMCYSVDDFKKIPKPFVIKSDDFLYGLQTTIVTDDNFDNVYEHIKLQFLKNKKILVEEFVKIKREYSFHILCNEKSWTYIGSARDYKKIYEADKGFNTVSMGSYNAVEDIDILNISKHIDNLLNYMKTYTGFMYLGIIITEDNRLLISEINTRPGDPELQSILPIIDNDLTDLLYKTVTNQYLPKINFNDKNAVTIKVNHKNYLDAVNYDLDAIEKKDWSIYFKKIKKPIFVDVPDDIVICDYNYNIVTNVSLTTVKETRKEASDYLYDYLKTVDMGDYAIRNDIGYLD
jgi:phosphoribosylamine-glycine ligase